MIKIRWGLPRMCSATLSLTHVQQSLKQLAIKRPLIILFGIAFLIFLSKPILGQECKLLTGKEYFEVLHELISSASKSVDIQMYFMIPDSKDTENPISVLIDDLIRAKGRGVRLRIILEDSKFKENHLAYKTLTLEGIEVDFDSPASLLHSKAVVIDREISIIGSTNWSRAAIFDNHEVSILVRSKELAEELLDDFSKIRLRKDVPVLPQKLEGVGIPDNFLLSEKSAGKLVKNRARFAFDLYLILLRESQKAKSDTIFINRNRLIEELGCKNLRRVRHRLDKTYNLIRYDPKTKIATLKDLDDGENYFILPFEYWDYGLNKRLSLRAKYMYLVTLFEAKKSTKDPYWFRSQEDLARLYGISDYTISLAVQELERANILEVCRSIAEKGDYEDREANVYRLNPLISPEEFKEKEKTLIEKYGKKLFTHAKELSAQLNEPLDLEDIETFIYLIQEFGYNKVKEKNDITAKMKKGSGLRDISNTIRLLKKE